MKPAFWNQKARAITRWWHSYGRTAGAVACALLLGTAFWLSNIWSLFVGLQKELAAALIAGAATILVSVISVVFGKVYERKRAIEQEIRDKKIPMYEEFVQFLFRMLMGSKLGKPLTEKEMLSFFDKFTQKLMVWGSDEVVAAWSTYRRSFVGVNPDHKKAITGLEDLLLAIRRDTGHRNRHLERGDLLGLFINDVDNVL